MPLAVSKKRAAVAPVAVAAAVLPLAAVASTTVLAAGKVGEVAKAVKLQVQALMEVQIQLTLRILALTSRRVREPRMLRPSRRRQTRHPVVVGRLGY